jgi:transcription termination/antitermination protein NusG
MTTSETKSWYAVYTAPRAEKKVSERFNEAGIEHYLPLQTVKRRWSDRVKEVIVPVVHGYIFVRIEKPQFKQVLSIYGAISFVREFGKPVSIPDVQIKQLKFMVDCSEEPVDFSLDELEKGETITIIRGPLQGLVGELKEVKGKHKVVIRIEKFGCALTTIPLSFIKRG